MTTARAQMVIRRSVHDVFESFADPEVTTRFWFTKSTGRLEPGAHVEWTWEMYDAHAQVDVKDVEPDRRILIQWDGYGTTPVEFLFTPRKDGATFVEITNSDITSCEDAISSTQGFTCVLAGLKALLEHDIELNLVADHHPAD